MTASVGTSNILKITIKNKANNKPVNGILVKVKVFTGNNYKVYAFKVNNGIVNFYTTHLSVGIHKLVIFSGYDKYYISKVSRVVIKE